MLKRNKAPASAATPAEAIYELLDGTSNPHWQYIIAISGNASALLWRVNSRHTGMEDC